MNSKGFAVLELLVGLFFLSLGATAVYGLWETFHEAKIPAQPGITEVAVHRFEHGRAWESKLGGQIAVFKMQDDSYWVWVGQRRVKDMPVLPATKGRMVLITDDRQEAISRANDIARLLAQGRSVQISGKTVFLKLPISRSEAFGTHYNWIHLESI